MPSHQPHHRHAARRPMHELRDLYEIVFDEAPRGMMLQALDGRVLRANRAACEILGRSTGELGGLLFEAIVLREDVDTDGALAQRLLRGEILRYDTQKRCLRRDGTTIHAQLAFSLIVDRDGRPRYRVVEIDDVTERVASEAALRASEAALRERESALKWLWTVVEQCPVGITLVMDRAGTKTMTNLRGQRLFGRTFSRDTETAEYATLVRTPDGRPLSLREMPSQRAMRGEVVPPVELLLCRPDGRQIPSLINAAALVDAQGQVHGAVVVFEDITPQKELERLRTEWSSIVAHDLRQPLNAIAVHAQLIAMGAPALEAPLRRISQAVVRLNRMVQDLLDLSQLEARRMVLAQENVDLVSLAGRCVDLVSSQAVDRSFELRVCGDAPFVTLDPDRIAQVLENLLSNAVKYGAVATPILVEIDTTRDDVAVAVTNEGPGIDPVELPHLFNRFYRVEGGARVKGVGLGLYIARELVEAHGGHVAAVSAPGGTTTFRFTIPRGAPLGAP
jgi:PAS domain S-box-containing protein